MTKFERVAIVTGGSKGIGEGCVRALCTAGGRVVICDIDAEAGTQLAQQLTSKGLGECHFESCDVRKPEDLKRAIDKTAERYGRLDCLVNNAGWHPPSLSIDDFSIADFMNLLQLNLVAVFAGCKLALPHLRKTHGSIINISSLVAVIGQEFATTYRASKGAVSAFTKALAIDEARFGVRVKVMLPWNIVTPMRHAGLAKAKDPQAVDNWLESTQWIGRSGTIDEAGQACLFLASDSASFITGVELILSGGAELGYGVKTGLKPS